MLPNCLSSWGAEEQQAGEKGGTSMLLLSRCSPSEPAWQRLTLPCFSSPGILYLSWLKVKPGVFVLFLAVLGMLGLTVYGVVMLFLTSCTAPMPAGQGWHCCSSISSHRLHHASTVECCCACVPYCWLGQGGAQWLLASPSASNIYILPHWPCFGGGWSLG